MKKFNLTLVSNNKGFTLLEILIAIALLAFISIGVVEITENAARTKESTTARNADNLQVETAMNRLEWDISQIYSPLYFSTVLNMNTNNQTVDQFGNNGNNQTDFPSPQGNQQTTTPQQPPNPYLQQYYQQLVQRFQNNEHFMAVSKEGLPIPRFYAPEKNVFEFFTSSNRRKVENEKQSHFAWVRYSLGDQEQLPEEAENSSIPKSLKSLVRYYSADNPYGDKRIDVEEIKGAALLRNVESLEFQYWDLQKRKWESNLRNIQGGESVIRGVKVLVTWYDSTGNKRSATRVFRTHWPLVAPEDQSTQNVQNAGAQNGQAGQNQNGTNTDDFN